MKLYCPLLHLTSPVPNFHSVGIATSPSLYLHVCRALWTIYRTALVPFDRLLRSAFRSRELLTERSKKNLKVSPLSLHPSPAVFTHTSSSKTSTYYVCSGCQSFYEQPLGRIVEKSHQGSAQVNLQFKTHSGPPVSEKCPECNSTLHVSRVFWFAPRRAWFNCS